MNAPSTSAPPLLPSFVTNTVECVEALTIGLASRVVRPWQSELIGTVANLLLFIAAVLPAAFCTSAALRSDT